MKTLPKSRSASRRLLALALAVAACGTLPSYPYRRGQAHSTKDGGATPAAAALEASAILLEDFGTMRLNPSGSELWSHYQEGASGVAYVDNGALRDDVGSYQYNGGGAVYDQFWPYAAGYPFPAGFAQHYVKSGTWRSDVNRLRFWVKSSIDVPRRPDGGNIIEIGTYVKDHNNPDTAWQGDHYYHALDPNVYAGRWMLVILNRVPQHQVGADPSTNWPENPSAPAVDYYDGLTRFYFDGVYGTGANSSWWFDDFVFDTVADEPDALVSSITAVYTGTHYEVSFAGPKNIDLTYDVRHAITSMKVAGFLSGTDAGSVSTTGNTYTGVLWQSPPMAEQPALYIAIRPRGGSPFTEVYLPEFGGDPAARGVISLVASSDTVGESAGTVTVTASRTGGTSGIVGVSYATSDGSALAGGDYIGSTGALAWGDGDSAPKAFTISLLDDASTEGPETFTVTLSDVTGGAMLGSPSSTTVTIVDGDSPGNISLAASSYTASENGGTVTITAVRAGGSTGTVGVSYTTKNGTAAADTDYVTSTGTLSWASGDTADKTLTVTMLDDAVVEGNESFTVTLSNPTGGATLGSPGSATATILDDDSFGTIALSASSYSVNETGGALTITATRTGGSSGAVGVGYASSNGTALAGIDYTPSSGSLSWTNGETGSKTFSVSILDDIAAEANETFTVALSGPTGGAALGSPSAATVTILGNEGTVQTAGLQLWLRADAGVTAAGTTVSQWTDQSGNNRNAVQGTASSQPVLVTDALNGRPALSFDGVNDFMTFTLPVNALTGMTLVLVSANSADRDGGSTNAESSALFWNETSSWGTVYLSPYQTNVKFRFGTGQAGNLPSYIRPASPGNGFSTSVAVKSGTTDSLYVDGSLALSQPGKLPTIALCQSTGNLGRGYNNDTYFPGMIAETLVYNRALSDSERQGLENYLTAKYFSAAAPSITVTAPNGGEIWTAGTSATVTWASTGAVGSVDIDLSIDGGITWATLAANTSNDGAEATTVPNTPSAACRIRVKQAGGGSPSGTSSADFTIAAPNLPPTIMTPAAANPSPVTGASTSLSVLGTDDGGEAAVTYTWAATAKPTGAADPTYGVNGSNSAKNTTATFSQAGTYALRATVRDAGGLSTTSSVIVTVDQTLATVGLAPSSASVGTGGTVPFTAAGKDQFGANLSSQPVFSWSVGGGGNIDSNGLFSAGSTAGGPFAVTASGDGRSGTASVTVTAATVPTAGLQLWLRADAGVTVVGTGISRWADQSGNNRDAVQAATSSRPALATDAVNGKPAVSFNGSDDFMTFNLPANGLTGMTLVLVSAATADRNGGSTNAGNAAIFWNETSSWGTVYLSPFQTNVQFRFGTGQTGNLPSYTRPASIGSGFSVSVATKNGTTDSLYVDGALVSSEGGKLPTIAFCRNNGNLGRGYNNNTYFPGRIAEVLVYNRALSDSDRRSVEEYLNAKYAPSNP